MANPSAAQAEAVKHSILPPSSAAVWVNCPGSVKMCQQFPERPDSPQSLEGTAAHWVASELLANRPHPVGSLAPNSIAITEEMRESAELFVEVFPPECASVLISERRVDCIQIHPECWGTSDASAFRDRTLRLADLKFGHAFVDEYQNMQLICYAVGELDALQFDWSGAKGDLNVELTIVQPRCFSGAGPVRTWKTTALALRPFIAQLQQAAQAALSPDAECKAGGWCNYCTAIHACPAAQRAVSNAISMAYMSYVAEPVPMSPASVSLMLRRLLEASTLIKAMQGGLEEEAEALIRRGVSVPGFTLQAGRGKLDWNKPIEEVLALGAMFGIDLSKPGAVTPTQAKKLLSTNGIDDGVISEYSANTSGALKLVQNDATLTSRIFNQSI